MKEGLRRALTGAVCAAFLFLPGATWGSGRESAGHVCFRVVDADGDGCVTAGEFKKIYGSAESRFTDVDADGDGCLTHEEYHGMLGHGSS